jgi:hypothetical protein
MSFWDGVSDFVGAVADGDAEGAKEAAEDTAAAAGEAVVDGVNATGDAASDATGGAVDVDVDEDGMSAQVGGISGRLDTDGRDGSVGGGVEVPTGLGATMYMDASADTDTSDGTAGVEAEVGGRAGDREVAVGTDIGNSDQPEGQMGIDIGARIDSAEVGVTANLDTDDEQAGFDIGGYSENEDGRIESGVTVNVDKSQGQVGVDLAGYVEGSDADGKEGARQETGVTVNLDGDATRMNLDAAVFTELDSSRPGYEGRAEVGVTTGFSADTGKAGYTAGVFGELMSDDSERKIRGEEGFGAGVVELSEDDTGSGVGFGVGTRGAIITEQDGRTESRDIDFYVGASVDEDGVVIGASGGMDSTEGDGRNTAQMGVRLGADDGRVYGGVVMDGAGDADYEAGVWVGADGEGGVGTGTYGRGETGEDLDFGVEERDPIRIQGEGIRMGANEDDPESGSDESTADTADPARRAEAVILEPADEDEKPSAADVSEPPRAHVNDDIPSAESTRAAAARLPRESAGTDPVRLDMRAQPRTDARQQTDPTAQRAAEPAMESTFGSGSDGDTGPVEKPTTDESDTSQVGLDHDPDSDEEVIWKPSEGISSDPLVDDTADQTVDHPQFEEDHSGAAEPDPGDDMFDD